jgi:hypothetical protein
VGFSRDYSDLSEWADDIWNPAHPENAIGTPAHFSEDKYLMSGGAGFVDGKSGRSFLQPADLLALEGAYGYMIREPATPALSLVALILAVTLGPRMRMARARTGTGASLARDAPSRTAEQLDLRESLND